MIDDGWDAAATYEDFMGRWSRPLARQFVSWLDVPPDVRWLDVGTGTGALVDAICAVGAPESVVACDPSAPFIEAARQRLPDRRVEYVVAAAGSLPPSPSGYAAVVSSLVLNFIDDVPAALEEQAQLASSDGVVAACVWDYAGEMQFLRHFWDAARGIDQRAEELDEGIRFPICRREALASLFSSTGLARVTTTSLTVPTVFNSFDDYWAPFVGGTGPAPSFAASLAESDRDALRESLRGRLPSSGDGRVELRARAWAVAGYR
jgi:trans-aconitate methyltransferase